MGELDNLLYQALASPYGICLLVSNFQLAQQRLYAARVKTGDAALSILQFRHSPTSPDELWIVKTARAPNAEV